jgi:ceramide glucosyltransferase
LESEVLLYLLIVVNVLLVSQGLFSVIEGQRYLAFVRRSLKKPGPGFTPPVCVICPCKEIDPGLEENLAALLNQDYPDYHLVFAIARPDDLARPVIERSISRSSIRDKAILLIAAPNTGRGEKINNLLCALRHVAEDRRVLAFADSDARPGRDWLRALVSPLEDAQVGASTGYRWYLPVRGGFWSRMLSAWNGSVATTLGDHGRNFAWGGSTAITREAFDRAQVAEAWSNAVSDDYALTRAIQQAGLQIRFVPRCLLASRDDASLKSLLEFTTRQVIITRVYRPAAWRVGFISQALFVLGFFGEVGLLVYQLAFRAVGAISSPMLTAATGGHQTGYPQDMVVIAISVGLIYLLGSLKGIQRVKSAVLAMAEFRSEILKCWWMFCLLWPLVSVLFLYNFVRSAMTRRILWRGIRYELRSPSETVIIDSSVSS